MNNSQLIAATLFAAGLFCSGCKKETEIQIKEIDKKYSWSEVIGFFGLGKVILSTGHSSRAIYLQQPNLFTRFASQNLLGDKVSCINPVSDVRVRMAIGAQIFAYPETDTTLAICRNDEPLNYVSYVPLKRFDQTAVRLDTHLFNLSKCMAINENNYVLAPYDNNRPGRPHTFLLAAVTPGTVGSGPMLVRTQQVVIPRTVPSGAYVRNLVAIDDYFLVNMADAGIYKINQDGTFRQVHGPALADTFYKWQNTVYAPVEYNQLLTSTNDGDTWQMATGTPLEFTLANYYQVRDSLVGVHSGIIYSLRWNGPRYTMRILKNDGLGQTTITGIECLHDTVYVATTSGLFARPATSFFESK